MAPKIQFDLSSLDRGQLILLIGSLLILVALIVGGILLLSAGNDQPDTADLTLTQPPTSTLTPSRMPSPTVTSAPAESPTPAATPTLEPYQYTVRSGDTLVGILTAYGYRTLDVVSEVLRLNNMSSETDLQANQTLLIPRMTPTAGPTLTPSPTPGEGTPTFDPNQEQDFSGCSPENRCLSLDGQYWMHEIVEGDTCASIANRYDTTVPDIIRDNNLTQNCFLQPGRILQVFIRVTLTPTLTPTGGPDSTATPTPTLTPPRLVAPANNSRIARSETVALQWASAYTLDAGETYLVVVRNTQSGDEHRATTRASVYRLPDDLRPSAGQSATFEWRVVIVAGQAIDSVVISGQAPGWTFTWGQ